MNNQEALDRLKTTIDIDKNIYRSYSSSYEPFMEDIGTLQQVIYDLELYKKAFEIMTDNKHTFFVCKGRGPASNEMVREAILFQARKELEND